MRIDRLVVSVVAFGLLVLAGAYAQEDEEERPTSYWMQKKLEYSQQILNGLTTEDFGEVRKNASAMRRLSRIEAFVRRSDTQHYRTQLQIFDFANDELIQAAEDENAERSALALTQLILSCVNCHKVIRQPVDEQP